MKTLLFIPMYNCEKQIVRVLAQLDAEIMQYLTEVVVVNNRSTDNGENAAIQFCTSHPELPISILRNDDNYGLGGSHKVAFQYAIDNQFDYVIVLHGDDQGNIRDLLPVLQDGRYQKYDCCLGARFMKGSKLQGYSKFRTFGNFVYDGLYSVGCGFAVKDLGSGLNMYKVSALQSKYYEKYPDNLIFNCCMLMAVRFYKQSKCFFPISWREDDQISNVKMFSQAKKTLWILAQFMANPAGFMAKEMRERPVEAYTAQIIHTNK